jgi:hypothetical protein
MVARKPSKFVYLVLLFALAFVFVVPVLAAPAIQAEDPAISPEELSVLITGIVGLILSAAFKYVPSWRTWYEGLAHQGVVMLGLVSVVGAAYFYLACTPWASQLGIVIACEDSNWFLLVRTIGYMVVGNQAGYLMLPNKE